MQAYSFHVMLSYDIFWTRKAKPGTEVSNKPWPEILYPTHLYHFIGTDVSKIKCFKDLDSQVRQPQVVKGTVYPKIKNI